MVSIRTRRAWVVTATIAGLGAVGGALTAIALTYLGSRFDAHYAPNMVVYRWNITIFAILGAVFSPVLAWSMLRHVPLWRAVAEPALAGLAGTLFSFVVAPSLFLLIVPATILLAALRLGRVYRPRNVRPDAPERLGT